MGFLFRLCHGAHLHGHVCDVRCLRRSNDVVCEIDWESFDSMGWYAIYKRLSSVGLVDFSFLNTWIYRGVCEGEKLEHFFFVMSDLCVQQAEIKMESFHCQ